MEGVAEQPGLGIEQLGGVRRVPSEAKHQVELGGQDTPDALGHGGVLGGGRPPGPLQRLRVQTPREPAEGVVLRP
ncbi:hypothetical protein ABZT43_15395 [Streptomyces sp. NPDC005349]|uniref:hypothetical protein n=1 Tax=unclassified Streptomyces TaxID=2593676 RepID=UPI0033AFE2EE